MKILIVSAEAWRDDTNGGNVLSNIFAGFKNAEFAQIYRNSGEPFNSCCKQYFQMTDSMAVKNIVRHKKIGKKIVYDNYPSQYKSTSLAESRNEKRYRFFHKYNFSFFYAMKALVWKCAKWKTEELMMFIHEFGPDIIFAPCYGGCHMQKLDRYVQDIAKVPMISYISDDNYSLRQFRISPSYWINRFFVRRSTRKTFKRYSLVYTMTNEQKQELERELGANMKILCKGFEVQSIPTKTTVNSVIRVIYAGGIYLNRWKVLADVAKAIKEINEDGVKMHLDIYTSNELDTVQREKLNVDGASTVHKAVSLDDLMVIYSKSDLALHVESFDLKNRLSTRLSFSTKIVDCLASGCAVMAIAWNQQAGYKYLLENDAAICIDNTRNIKQALVEIVKNPKLLIDKQKKARECCLKNHDIAKNTKIIQSDFERIAYASHSD